MLRPTRPAMLSEGPTEVEAAAINAHFAYFSRLVQEDKLLLAGRTSGEPEKTIGIGILSAPSLEDAEYVVKLDPAVSAGVMSAEVQAFSVALFNTQATE
ncbi:MAG TPA: YciI family protein [Fimbriimonas sp.]|nr:YciI family protein [Fimbriimonas sp.]